LDQKIKTKTLTLLEIPYPFCFRPTSFRFDTCSPSLLLSPFEPTRKQQWLLLLFMLLWEEWDFQILLANILPTTKTSTLLMNLPF